jgi:hypothetical protein
MLFGGSATPAEQRSALRAKPALLHLNFFREIATGLFSNCAGRHAELLVKSR